PGLHFHLGAAKTASRAMIEAHARMYDAVHAADQWDADGDGTNASVGLVSAYLPVHPKRPGTGDVKTARDLAYLANDLYLDALVHGKLDEQWNGQTVDRPDLGGRMDFIGINYYMTLTVQKAWVPILQLFSPLLSLDPFQVDINGSYPEGLYEVIADLSRYKRPMMVTETGRDGADDASHVESWLVRTMAWTRQAIADGYDVRGYYYWTLFDNYEWNIGMKMRMGLYEVNAEDPMKTRRPRSAVRAYHRIVLDNAIPKDLLDQHVLPSSDPDIQSWRVPELLFSKDGL
ncbi:MAG: family 1 glycosylhydrolase, partial [Pseudobdellovibrionaceae bacterium]|nr:family 1 glycosylhydrolase [Pseudobdellovibrionaceae bacterium]